MFVAALVGEPFEGGFAETACGFADGVIGTCGEGGGFAVIVEGVVAGLGADGTAFFDESGAGGVGVVAVSDEDLAERGGGFPDHEERASGEEGIHGGRVQRAAGTSEWSEWKRLTTSRARELSVLKTPVPEVAEASVTVRGGAELRND